MLPAMAELMPPLLLDDLVPVDVVPGPQVLVVLVEEDALEDVCFVGDGRLVRARLLLVLLAELVLVVGAVERHFYLLGVLGVRVRVVHGPEAAGFAVVAVGLVPGEGQLAFLRRGFGLGR